MRTAATAGGTADLAFVSIWTEHRLPIDYASPVAKVRSHVAPLCVFLLHFSFILTLLISTLNHRSCHQQEPTLPLPIRAHAAAGPPASRGNTCLRRAPALATGNVLLAVAVSVLVQPFCTSTRRVTSSLFCLFFFATRFIKACPNCNRNILHYVEPALMRSMVKLRCGEIR